MENLNNVNEELIDKNHLLINKIEDSNFNNDVNEIEIKNKKIEKTIHNNIEENNFSCQEKRIRKKIVDEYLEKYNKDKIIKKNNNLKGSNKIEYSIKLDEKISKMLDDETNLINNYEENNINEIKYSDSDNNNFNKEINKFETNEEINFSQDEDNTSNYSLNKKIRKKKKKNQIKKNYITRPEKLTTEKEKISFLKNNIRFNFGEIKNLYEIFIQNKELVKTNNFPQKELINSLLKNQLLDENEDENKELENFITEKTDFNKYKHFINADIRYLNLDHVVDKLGYFDIIHMDPPWRIKGAQKNDSSFMFSNNRFSLEYNTMSNEQIRNIKIEKLSKKGFIFLWILANQIQDAGEMLNKWGYELVDMLIWVKLQNGLIFSSQGFYFMHSYEICLIGYKCPPGEKVEYNSKISNNIIFAEVRKKSQKPEEIYEIIDLMMPGSKKIEIFARNNNLKDGWFSVGNQLGEQFEKWNNDYSCNICFKKILKYIKRYKNKKKSNFDICETCWNKNEYDSNDFFEFFNQVDEDILHQYIGCNICKQDPIWGNKFSCKQCENYDLCEVCYDRIIEEDDLHDKEHEFEASELPILASGFPIHMENKCIMCYQSPIIGIMFKCNTCPKFSFCQYCYFKSDSIAFKNIKSHKQDHNFSIIMEPKKEINKTQKCSNCEEIGIYKCENCFKFFYCDKCYIQRRTLILNFATSHKHYHKLNKLIN